MFKIVPRVGWLFWVGIVLTLVASGISIAMRHRVEARNKAFALVLEAPLVAEAASFSGKSMDEVLTTLKAKGLGGLVIGEENLRERVQRSGTEPEFRGGGQIAAPLDASTPRGIIPPRLLQGDRLVGPFETVMSQPVGLRPEWVDAAKTHELPIIARFSNRSVLNEEIIEGLFSWAKANGVIGYLPQGDQVLGFRSTIPQVADGLERHQLLYLSPEFAKMSGEERLLGKSLKSAVRLHAIQAAEADKLSPSAYNERFGKAFSERNQRFLLLRPLEPSSSDPVQALATTLESTRKAVEKEGGVLAPPKPFQDPGVPSLVKLLIQAGLACVLAGFFMVSIPDRTARPFLMALSGALVVFPASYAALLGAIALPILAYVALLHYRDSSPWLQIAIMFVISLVGGLAVAGLLTGLPYFVKAAVFPGVKIAHFAPIAVILVLMAGVAIPWKEILNRPLTLGAIITGLAALMVLALMAARTGNDSPAGVSGAELALRSLLEQVLVVRPRTKEFLIGYPLLVVGLLGMKWARERGLPLGGWPLVVGAGSIALTSVVNTLCHLHTPIAVGLTRIAIGLVLGLCFGLLAWIALHQLVLKRRPLKVNA